MLDTYQHKLSNGLTVIVDTEDAWMLRLYNPTVAGGYVRLWCGNRGNISLSRVVADCEDTNLVVDHINRNTLDNRRINLRVTTQSKNNINRANFGKYPIGITFNKTQGKFIARITVDGVRKHLGSFIVLQDACDAYNYAAQKYHGEFAQFSDPGDVE